MIGFLIFLIVAAILSPFVIWALKKLIRGGKDVANTFKE